MLGFWNNSGSSYKYSYRPRMTTGSEGSVSDEIELKSSINKHTACMIKLILDAIGPFPEDRFSLEAKLSPLSLRKPISSNKVSY